MTVFLICVGNNSLGQKNINILSRIYKMEEELTPLEKKRLYMRNYMKTRYHANLEGSRAYCKSVKAKKKNEISNEEFKTFGFHLANVLKLRQIKKELPPELMYQILCENDQEIVV
jgi:hypothetical protein